MKPSFSTLVAVTLAFAYNAEAYWVGPAKSLEEIAEESYVIFKGTCVSGKEVQDEWFKPLSGFKSVETEFKVVSVIKGENVQGVLRFRHYDQHLERTGFISYWPQWHHFEPGSTYLIFAKATGVPGVFRQLWENHTGMSGQGVFQCADAEPVKGDDLKQVVWTEMHRMIQSNRAENVLYGISQLDLMSNMSNDDPYDTTKDFDRLEVLKSIHPLTTSTNEDIALQAITAIGSRNPYMTEDGIRNWLSSIEARDVFRIEKMNAKKNPGGTLYESELVSITKDRSRTGKTRSTAVRALGLVRNETVINHLEQSLKEPEPLVRSAAALLVADVPLKQGTILLRLAIKDQAPEVRTSAAYAIGIGRHIELVETLGIMLKDPDVKVRRAASMSLLTFSAKDLKVAGILKENIDNKEFKPLFLNALAAESIEPYLESIATVVEQNTEPANSSTIASLISWKLLFKHLVAQPQKELQGGKWDRYLTALEDGYTTGSSEPTKIYCFYLQRGLTERARKYRAMIMKTNDYDLYFDRVDADPKSESLEL